MKEVILSMMLPFMAINPINPANHANLNGPVPTECPSIESIASRGLDHVTPEYYFQNWLGMKERDQYNTAFNWSVAYGTGGFKKKGSEIIENFGDTAKQLTIVEGPIYSEEHAKFICVYHKDKPIPAIVAVYPPFYSA